MATNRLSLYEAAREAARLGGQRARQLLHAAEARTKSESYNLVTDGDLETEQYIRDILSARFPSHEILGEEGRQDIDANAPSLWIVDPIDGTNNYAHAVPHYCTSVAYAEEGQLIAAAIFDPERRELFSAYAGGGAYLNGDRISLSPATSLSQSLVCTGFYYNRGEIMEQTLEAIRRLFGLGIHGIRRTGSAALDLCWTACGRFDAYFEYDLGVWDFAAGALILQEAGGSVSETEGGSHGVKSRTIAASAPGIHRELLNAIGR